MDSRIFKWISTTNMVTINNHFASEGFTGFEVGYAEDDGSLWVWEGVFTTVPPAGEEGHFDPITEINAALGSAYADLEAWYLDEFGTALGDVPSSIAEDNSSHRTVRKVTYSNFVKDDTTLTTPTDGTNSLSWDGLEGEEWDFEAHLYGGFQSSADLRVRVKAPSASLGVFVAHNVENAYCERSAINGTTGSLPMSSGNDDIVTVRGTVVLSGDGNCEIQIRNNSGSDTQTVYAFSKLIAIRQKG
jgi:hypothetical protein